MYDDIEKFFKSNNVNALSSIINEAPGYELLQRDLNFGLAQQVLACLTKHRIRNLTRTYITLSLLDIANKVSTDVPTTERHLLKMIKNGEIEASIDGVTGIVRFGNTDVGATSTGHPVKQQGLHHSLNATIETALDQTVQLSEKLREMHKKVILSNSYLLKTVQGGSGGRRGDWASDVPMDTDIPVEYL